MARAWRAALEIDKPGSAPGTEDANMHETKSLAAKATSKSALCPDANVDPDLPTRRHRTPQFRPRSLCNHEPYEILSFPWVLFIAIS